MYKILFTGINDIHIDIQAIVTLWSISRIKTNICQRLHPGVSVNAVELPTFFLKNQISHITLFTVFL